MHYHNVSTDYSCTESEIGIVASSQKYLPSLSTRSARAAYESLLMTRWDAGMKSSIYDWKDTFYLVCTVSRNTNQMNETIFSWSCRRNSSFPRLSAYPPIFDNDAVACPESRVPTARRAPANFLFDWQADRRENPPEPCQPTKKSANAHTTQKDGDEPTERNEAFLFFFLLISRTILCCDR